VKLHPRAKFSLLLVTAAVALVATGCPKKPQPPPAPAEQPKPVEEKPLPEVKVPKEPTEITKPAEPTVKVDELDDVIRAQNENRTYLKTIYFDFDKYELRQDTIATLKNNASWIKSHSNFKVLVEGHCDERGTIEYNLELGAKRAHAVQEYLINLGVERSRLRTISYGEERPVNPGHDEGAWAKNRRAEFTLEK